ncbi:Protein bli-3 [Fusarium oxysporum f. sp. albedinis]|nr:Protein bli-3 [Fusarium oxysporum f. sp. albedinis]
MPEDYVLRITHFSWHAKFAHLDPPSRGVYATLSHAVPSPLEALHRCTENSQTEAGKQTARRDAFCIASVARY